MDTKLRRKVVCCLPSQVLKLFFIKGIKTGSQVYGRLNSNSDLDYLLDVKYYDIFKPHCVDLDSDFNYPEGHTLSLYTKDEDANILNLLFCEKEYLTKCVKATVILEKLVQRNYTFRIMLANDKFFRSQQFFLIRDNIQ